MKSAEKVRHGERRGPPWQASQAGRAGLRKVSRREGADAAAAGLVVHAEQLVERSSELEGACVLQALGLDEDASVCHAAATAHELIEKRRLEQRRPHDPRAYCLESAADAIRRNRH